MIKLSWKKASTAFADFQQTAKLFPTNFNSYSFQYPKFQATYFVLILLAKPQKLSLHYE